MHMLTQTAHKLYRQASLPGLAAVLIVASAFACDADTSEPESSTWARYPDNPVYRDFIPEESYEAASDPHVFFSDKGELAMIYTGDVSGVPGIKLARGSAWADWQFSTVLLSEAGPSGQDVNKETAFYRKTEGGKHQLYYIGYPDETSYEAEVYLAEADALEGPYVQLETPVVPRGKIAGKDVYCITSPSIVEHEGVLHMMFLGWNASPHEVTEVWVLGATSSDEGRSWSAFQEVDTKIGMEGQVTKAPDGSFSAVRTGSYQDKEAIFISTAPHPFGPWERSATPILVQADASLEKDEIIAPQLTYDPVTDKPYLYYTGADYQTGWWIMLATQN